MTSFAMSDKDLFSQPSYVVVTGASRGYGRELAKCIAFHLQLGSSLILSSRNEAKLAEVKQEIAAVIPNNKIHVQTIVCDLSNSADVKAFVKKCTEKLEMTSYKNAIFLHNAASIGDTTLRVDQHVNLEFISTYMDLNVSHLIYLNNHFLTLFSKHTITCWVINISSLAAIQPMASCGLYCTGKAARDMVFKVLAAERPDVRVLNWAPGPMPTEMMSAMMNSFDKGISDTMKELHSKQTYITCKESAEKLINLLKTNTFSSGEHIDVYDV